MATNQIGTGILTGVPGSELATVATKEIAGSNGGGATTTWTLDIGDYFIFSVGQNISTPSGIPGAHVQCELFDGASWVMIAGPGISIPFLHADGASVRFNNTGTNTQGVNYVKIGASSKVTAQATS